MSKVLITRSKLDGLATTIAEKSGATLPLTIAQMDTAVQSISGGGVTVEALNVTANGTYTAQSGKAYSPVTVAVPGVDTSQDTVDAAHLLDGYTAHDSTGSQITGSYTPPTFTTQAKTATPTTSSLTISPDSGYDGLSSVTVGAIPSEYIIPSGTKSITENGAGIDVAQYAAVDVDVPIPTFVTQSKTATPTESQQTITPDSGYDGLSSVSVGAISSTYVGSGIDQRSSTDLTASGATVTVPAGYYAAQASKAVASGSAGTPTATKGTVSNHAVSVTPSVTNTTGYIAGGTKTGTAVSVAASELVSGTYTVSASGTHDVTNYASASVASGGATASATKGAVSNHSVTVTPSVTRTAGYVTAGTTNGTAVTVSASELVSGSETKTANGTYNVTNLASLVVAVPIVTYHTSSSAPTSSQGSDGDIWLVTS